MNLPEPAEQTVWGYFVFNFWSILGVVVSGVGLWLAFWQLKKIANRTKTIDQTYKQITEDLEKRDAWMYLGLILHRLDLVKRMLRERQIQNAGNELSSINKAMVALRAMHVFDGDGDAMSTMSGWLVNLELDIIRREGIMEQVQVVDFIAQLTELELKMTDVQSKLKYPKR